MSKQRTKPVKLSVIADGNTVEALERYRDDLQQRHGLRLSMSQTAAALINKGLHGEESTAGGLRD